LDIGAKPEYSWQALLLNKDGRLVYGSSHTGFSLVSSAAEGFYPIARITGGTIANTSGSKYSAWMATGDGRIIWTARIPTSGGTVTPWSDYSGSIRARDLDTGSQFSDGCDMVFLVSHDGRKIYRGGRIAGDWNLIYTSSVFDGSLTNISVGKGLYGSHTSIYVTTSRGRLLRLDCQWGPSLSIKKNDMTGTLPFTRDVAVQDGNGAQPELYVIAGSTANIYGYSIYRYDMWQQKWYQCNGIAERIAVDMEGRVWVVNSVGDVFLGYRQ